MRDPLVLLVLAVGVGLRLAWVLSARYGVVDDTLFYHVHATDLANLDGYRSPTTGEASAFLPPGYPLLLAVPYAVFGSSTRVAGIVNVVLAGITMVLVAALARTFFGRWAAALAGLGFALFPSQVLYVSAPHSDLLLTTLVMAIAVVALGAAQRRFSGWRMVWLGLLFGAALLTAGQTAFLLPALLLAWAWPAGWREAARRSAIVAVVAGLVVLPWAVRNALQVGDFTLATNGGPNLWIGNNARANGGWISWEPTGNDWDYPPDEAAFDRERRDDALGYIVDHPWDTISLWPTKLLETWRSDFHYVGHFSLVPHRGTLPDFMEGERLERYLNAWHRAVLGAGVAAAALLLVLRHRGRVLVPFALGLVLPTVVFFGLDRYHVPVLPLLVVLASSIVSVAPGYVMRGIPRRGSREVQTAVPAGPVAART